MLPLPWMLIGELQAPLAMPEGLQNARQYDKVRSSQGQEIAHSGSSDKSKPC